MSDLLFRGRDADSGVRAPIWRIRVAGALLALAAVQMAATLGVWQAVGMSVTTARLLTLVVGLWLAPTQRGVWLWSLSGAVGLLLLVVSYTPLVVPLAPYFVRRDADSAQTPDAVVVLSGAVTSEGHVMGPALDRLLSGMAEAKRREVPYLALSIVGDESDPTVATSERDQRALARTFAPELQLRFVRHVRSTRDEALAFAALARTQGWRRVVLVTSPTHTRRACATVEATGLPVQCLPAVSRSYSLARLDRAEPRRLAFADVTYEAAAAMLYRLRGWL